MQQFPLRRIIYYKIKIFLRGNISANNILLRIENIKDQNENLVVYATNDFQNFVTLAKIIISALEDQIK